jgi:hypothetical protein
LFFRQHGRIGPVAKVVRITGRVRREAGGKQSEFQLWISDADQRPVPLRIDYRAKTYLKLTFVTEG